MSVFMPRRRADSEPVANKDPIKPPSTPFSSVAAAVIVDEAAKVGAESCAQPWCVECKAPHDKHRKTVVTYMEILSLLADRDKNFWWDTFSHRVVAEYPSSWDFLDSVSFSQIPAAMTRFAIRDRQLFPVATNTLLDGKESPGQIPRTDLGAISRVPPRLSTQTPPYRNRANDHGVQLQRQEPSRSGGEDGRFALFH